jgi:hypothetical protein
VSSAWRTPRQAVMVMLANESQNLLPILEIAEAGYSGPAAQLPLVGRDRLTRPIRRHRPWPRPA